MKRPLAKRWLLGCCLAAAAMLAAFWWLHDLPQPATLTTEAYVWQRGESADLHAALERARPMVTRFHFLGSEISRSASDLRVNRSKLPPELLRGQGAVLRLGASLAKENWQDEALDRVLAEVKWLVSLGITELQIDFDCPQSRLGTYRELLEQLKPRCPGMRLAITALPAWLGEKEAAGLFSACDGVVLQVHSLHLPARPEQPVVLCDPGEARTAVDRMAKHRRPFRVALNTYACEVLFDAAGKVVEVVAEDTATPAPAAAVRRSAGISDATALADLVAAWRHRPPPGLTGIVWYRLPLESDRRNWRWVTWAKVAAGETPVRALECHARPAAGGAWDIVLSNTGECDEMLPEFLVPGCDPLVLEGLNGYDADVSTRLRLGRAPWPWLPPGASLVAGWLRTPDAATPPRPAVVSTP